MLCSGRSRFGVHGLLLGMTDARVPTERLWELLSDKLRSFLRRQVGDDHAAEDLLQETFVRIHKRLNDLDDESRLHAWVFRIARNLATDHLRARTPSDVDDQDVPSPESESDDDENLNAVVREWLPPMIAQLPDPYREALQMYEFEHLPQQEIADRLGISLSGAKSRIQRGREKLKGILFDCCSFERDRRGNVIGFTRNGPAECGEC